MIPLHLFYQIYPSSTGPDYCTPPTFCELSEYTDSAHTEVEDAGELSEYTDSAHTEEDVGELSEYTDSAHTECSHRGGGCW